jgi:hypothetical protein
MSKLYRIEIDVVLEDRMRSKVIQAASDHYKNSDGAWSEEDGQMVRIAAEEFVADTRTAFLERKRQRKPSVPAFSLVMK